MEIFTYQLFTPDEVSSMLESIQDKAWTAGVTVNPEMAKKVKFNRELHFSDAKVELKKIMDRISANTQLQKDTMIRKILPPKFNRYSQDGEYKRHSDAPYMDVNLNGKIETLRTDYSMTIFLTEGYEGGKLVIEGDTQVEIKGPIGSCVVYPSDSIHYVTPVTEGERICAITWLESRIKDNGERSILRDLRSAMLELEMFSETQTNLSSIHGRLTRKWSK